jgi:hypothetical protein
MSRTLVQLREDLARESAHHELVIDFAGADYSDDGADYYLNAAQRWLDDMFPYRKSQAWYFSVLAAGQSLVTFNSARYVERVVLASGTDGRTELIRKTQRELQVLYSDYTDVPLSSLDQGTPEYWAPAVIGLAPEQYAEDATTLAAAGAEDLDFLAHGNHYPLQGLIVMPPSDGVRTVEVLGRWYSKELSADADVSVWSVNHPDLLVRAAMRELEITFRNEQGVRAIEGPLLIQLKQISHNLAAEDAAGPTSESRAFGR